MAWSTVHIAYEWARHLPKQVRIRFDKHGVLRL